MKILLYLSIFFFIAHADIETIKEIDLFGAKQKNQLPSSLFIKKIINKKNCDQILRNQGYFTTCYSYEYKTPIYIHSKLNGALVKKKIKERPRFYDDLNIPKKYRATYSDYTHSGYNRGHSGVSDASFDHSQKSLKSTYVMSNIVPQKPITNQKSYLEIENYERKMAIKFKDIDVLTVNKFSKNPRRIGRNNIAVPDGFGKMFFNEDKKFRKCFYVKNDNISYKLKELSIDCGELF